MRGNRSKDDILVPGVDAPMVDDEPLVLVYCMMCKHWQAGFNPAFGHCLLAGKSMHGPFPTTDLSSCTRAEAK